MQNIITISEKFFFSEIENQNLGKILEALGNLEEPRTNLALTWIFCILSGKCFLLLWNVLFLKTVSAYSNWSNL